MGAMQRRKGARWEREVANWFRDAGHNAQRMAPMQTSVGSIEPDVMVSLKGQSPARATVRWGREENRHKLAVECKVGIRIQWMKALKQAKENSKNGTIPVVVAKIDRCDPVIMMTLADFNSLVRT